MLFKYRRTGKTEFNFMRNLGYDGTPRFFCNGETVYHFAGCSAFSEYTVIPANSCGKVSTLQVAFRLTYDDRWALSRGYDDLEGYKSKSSTWPCHWPGKRLSCRRWREHYGQPMPYRLTPWHHIHASAEILKGDNIIPEGSKMYLRWGGGEILVYDGLRPIKV